MVTKEAAIRSFQTFAEDILRTGLKLRRVFLFGSFARNQQHELSDIDVALVADEFIGVGFKDMDLFIDVLKNYVVIQTKTY